MGEVKVTVELENSVDRELAERGQLQPEVVRSETLAVLADTGSVMLVLPQDLVERLGLRVLRKAIVAYADERKEQRDVAGVVTVKVSGRSMETSCIVGPPGSEPLLGQIVLEATDLLVDPVNQKLVPRPESPYLPTLKLK